MLARNRRYRQDQALRKEKGHGEALPASPWPINAGTMAPIVPPSQSMV